MMIRDIVEAADPEKFGPRRFARDPNAPAGAMTGWQPKAAAPVKARDNLRDDLKELELALQQGAQSRGLTPPSLSMSNDTAKFIVTTKNGVKVEFVKRLAGGGMKPTIISTNNHSQEVVDELKAMGVNASVADSTKNTSRVKLPDFTNNKNLQQCLTEFWNIIDIIEDLGTEFSNAGSQARHMLDKAGLLDEKYYRDMAERIAIATLYNDGSLLSRGGGDSVGGYDIKDDLITVGWTQAGWDQEKNTGKKAYREHVVPCDLINKMGIGIVKRYIDAINKKYSLNGAGKKFENLVNKYRSRIIQSVAEMIERNLMIVNISNEQQQVIDSKYKTTMPAGWKDGDNPLARLTEFGYEVYGTDGQRLRESE